MILPISDTTPLFSQKRRSINAPPVKLDNLTISILQAVHRYRLLEWRQLLELFGSSFPNTQDLAKRIELLYRNFYLEEILRPLYPDELSKGQVYRLGAAGAQVLSGQLAIPFPHFHYFGRKQDKERKQTKVSRDYLSHSTELADIRMAFERWSAENSYEIELWRDETDLKRGGSWPRVDIETAQGIKERVPILPDGFFALVGSQGRAYFVLEHDRSTEQISRKWQRKILAYKSFVLSGDFHRHFGITGNTTPLRILTTTPTLARSQNLKGAAETYGASEATSLFLFTPLSELLAHDTLHSPIWLRAGTASLHSIL